MLSTLSIINKSIDCPNVNLAHIFQVSELFTERASVGEATLDDVFALGQLVPFKVEEKRSGTFYSLVFLFPFIFPPFGIWKFGLKPALCWYYQKYVVS